MLSVSISIRFGVNIQLTGSLNAIPAQGGCSSLVGRWRKMNSIFGRSVDIEYTYALRDINLSHGSLSPRVRFRNHRVENPGLSKGSSASLDSTCYVKLDSEVPRRNVYSSRCLPTRSLLKVMLRMNRDRHESTPPSHISISRLLQGAGNHASSVPSPSIYAYDPAS